MKDRIVNYIIDSIVGFFFFFFFLCQRNITKYVDEKNRNIKKTGDRFRTCQDDPDLTIKEPDPVERPSRLDGVVYLTR